MKEIHGWHLPDDDIHFTEYLTRAIASGQPCEYQKEHRDRAISYCKTRRTAVDIGGHVGLWSRPLTAVFDSVVSFEPMPDFRLILSINAPNALIMPFALGDLESTVRMELPADNSGMAHIVPDSEETGDINVRTLDSFDVGNVDFIKIDCEGYEYPILLGATRTLESCRPVIVIEQKPHVYFSEHWGQYTALEFLKSRCGYEVVDRVVDDWILVPG